MAVKVAVRSERRSHLSRLGPDRAVAIAVAGILLGASIVSVSAGRPAPATGGPTGDGPDPRIVVGGGVAEEGDDGTGNVAYGQPQAPSGSEPEFRAIDFGDELIEPEAPVSVEGPFIEDGTLIKPIAVDTTVPDGSALVKTYQVKAGDTLVGIASKFGVSMMSVWWANDLKTKDDLHLGQTLRIPPVTGLIIKVTATDTLDGLAARYGVNGTDILATNGLDDPNLVVGQVLVVPGAKGKPIPTPKPTTKPTTRSTSGSVRPPATYRGGSFVWPVVGGGNYISQYFRYGHYGLDIAADYGSRVRAAAAGTVIFAGWKSNGGGYQVWIAHGSGLYTTYNHMSGVSVGRGQHVSRGQQVGRVGQSGYATGPHLHFEVWRGPVWNGGRRVNPLAYL
jgi:murein DD-endopeptidase MepM/ murein hydrolase activator NlpD